MEQIMSLQQIFSLSSPDFGDLTDGFDKDFIDFAMKQLVLFSSL